jgi:hydrogenase-4 component E
MHLSHVDILAAGAAVIAVWMCGVTRVRSLLWGLGLQTAGLGLVAALYGVERNAPHYLILAGVVLVVKAAAIPVFLDWAAGRIGVRRDPGALLNPTLALLAGCGALAGGYFLTAQVAAPGGAYPGAAGMALAELFTGMLLMLTRRLALSQVIGFLVLENGIFLYALTQTHGMPLMVEMGVLLDVLVGVMVAGLIIFRLNRSFEHIDVTQLRGLRD